MIFLKRRAMMTRASFNYKTVNGIGSITLENCVETKFKRLSLSGNSTQGENPSIESPKEIKNSGKYDETSGKYLLDVEVKKYEKVSLEKGSLQWGSGEEIVHNGTRSDFVDISGMNKNFVFLVSPKHTLAMNLFFYTENKKYMNVVSIQPEKYYEKCSQYSYRNAPDGARYIRVSLNMYTYNENNEILIEEGSQSQTLTIPLDRPLTKWDRLVEQGGQIGWLYSTGVYEDIKESDISANSINDQYGRYYVNAIKAYKNAECMCNIAEYSPAQKENKCGFWWSDTLCFLISSEYTGNNGTEDNSTAIKNFKDNVLSKGITVFYKLNTEEFIPLPQSEQNAIRALKTYYPTTVITVDSGEVETGIEVEYAVKE